MKYTVLIRCHKRKDSESWQKFIDFESINDIRIFCEAISKLPDVEIVEPVIDFDKVDLSFLNINTVNQFQHDNPPSCCCKTYNEYLKEHFNAK